MRLLIIILFSMCLIANAQIKKFVVVGGTALNKIGIIGTGDSTLLTAPRVWLAYRLEYSQQDSFPDVSINTYRTYQALLVGQTLPTDLRTSNYKYRSANTLGDSIVADIRRYYVGLGYQATIVTK